MQHVQMHSQSAKYSVHTVLSSELYAKIQHKCSACQVIQKMQRPHNKKAIMTSLLSAEAGNT